MENIKIINGKPFETIDTEINVERMEAELAEMRANIVEQEKQCDAKQAKIDYIKTLINQA